MKGILVRCLKFPSALFAKITNIYNESMLTSTNKRHKSSYFEENKRDIKLHFKTIY